MIILEALFWPLRLVWWSALASFMLLVFFAAVMSFRDARDRGTLTGPLKAVGYPILVIGYALDFAVQMTVAVALFAEIPPYRWFTPQRTFSLAGRTFGFTWLRLLKVEPTVSERTKRLALTGSGWRQARAIWWRTNIMGPLDSSGGHS